MIKEICTLDKGHNRFQETSNNVYFISKGVKDNGVTQMDQKLKKLYVHNKVCVMPKEMGIEKKNTPSATKYPHRVPA